MRYVYFEFDGEKFRVETDDDHTALRQIIEDKNGQVLVSCRDCCLAEGIIIPEEFACEFSDIPHAEFESFWYKHTEKLRQSWSSVKEKFPVGAEISGTIRYFYPHGIIVKLDNAQGCADYDVTFSNSPKRAMYPGHRLSGVVSGYDNINYWILISESRAE